MSSQPPATPSTGTSKSAAKKRAKKAAKALAANKESIAAAVASSATAALSDPDTAARLAALEATYSLPPGSYPDAGYDRAYHDDAELPPAAAAGATGGANPDQFSFASYAFDRNLVAQANGSPFSGLSPSINITHEDLLETANELWKRMGETAYGEDDPYWSSLPTHVRQFIREAIPFNGNAPNNVNDPQATQKDLYAMAQRIVHAASQGMGLQGVGSNLLSQVNGRAHLQASIAEDLGFHRHPDAAGRAAEDDFEDEDEFDEELEPGYAQPNGDAPKKKNKKKKKKSTQVQEPPPAALPPPAVKQPPRQPVPPQPSVAPAQAASAAATTAAAAAPALNPPPPPVSAAPTNPPPSSRAAGKQPMPHAPQPPPNMVRSLRAAGKAPVSATSQTHHNHTHTHTAPASAKAPATKGKAVANTPPAKIWTTASAEERENITQFWLGLTEAERRDLLQIEKDAVLRRMKEQQRHSCGCAVCGRKKVNIEMELDQLYEQYYEDLERYTQHQRAAIVNDDCPRPPGAGPFPGSVELDPSGQLLKLDHLAPSAAQQASVEESDEYDDDDDYEDEEELDDDEIVSEEAETGSYAPRSKSGTKPATPKPEGGDDFYGFGSNLATIKGVITVADDMLKNDGAKFLEMMEQLAVKRVAREELNVRELQEETDEDEEEVDDISDAQRMEDGKRMFAIFAARMFEQRVLQAYRERVAKEREEQLLRELEMEEDSKRAREEKKAKEAQRKKDKKRAQKQRQDEERAAREAQLAEEQRLAKLKAEEDARERSKRQEEERARREAAKRAAQEEAVRKEAERRKRQEEERAREEEAARKKRELQEKIKKEREAREREAKEKERREREERERLAKERAEKERIAKEAREKAEKERLAKLEEERLEKQRRDEAARREREAAEQKKILAAQQAARERAAAEKAAAEKAAADKAKMGGAAIRPPPGVRPKVATSMPPGVRNGPSPPGDRPLVASPPTPSSVRPSPVARGPPKTPQTPYYSQPVPTMSAFNTRPSGPGGFVQGAFGARPPFPAQSPVFPAPQTNGGQGMMPGSLSGSPSALPRGYGAPPESAFDFDRPLGFPPKTPVRVGSTDDPFRAPGGPAPAPIGQRVPSQPASLYGEPDTDPFVLGRLDTTADPIGPPGPGPIGSRPTFDQAPGGAAPLRIPSPTQPDKVLGSAALGAADDEIVTPAARRGPPPGAPAPGWKMPQAPGAGRWSAAPPSIWGLDSTTSWSRGFGAPGGVGSPVSAGPVSAVSAASSLGSLGGPPPDFGVPVTPVGGSVGVGGGVPGVPPIGEARRRPPGFGPPGGGSYPYPPNLFGPPQHQ